MISDTGSLHRQASLIPHDCHTRIASSVDFDSHIAKVISYNHTMQGNMNVDKVSNVLRPLIHCIAPQDNLPT